MPEEKTIYSSKQVLEELAKHRDQSFSASAYSQRERELEQKMEDFDLDKRKKAAQSAEELSKLVITA
jgi:hypothetical protein